MNGRLLLACVLLLVGVLCLRQLMAQVNLPLLGAGGAVSGGGGCAQATSFIAREDGSQGNNAAMTTFICGLVTDGVFAKMDALYVFAANNTANAVLNLISSAFNITIHGTPAFLANNGFTGTGLTTDYLDTGFNPTTASSPNFTQNSAHISAWSNTNHMEGGALLGVANFAAGYQTNLLPQFVDGNAYFRINDNPASGSPAANANSLGHYVANRTGASASAGYKNGAILGAALNATSGAIQNTTILVLCYNEIGSGPGCTSGSQSTYQTMLASIGGALTVTDIANYCARAATYLNTVSGISKPC